MENAIFKLQYPLALTKLLCGKIHHAPGQREGDKGMVSNNHIFLARMFNLVSSLKSFAQFRTTIWNSFLPLPSAAKLLMCHQVILQHESLKFRSLQIHLKVVWEQLLNLKICVQQGNLEHLCSPTNKTRTQMFPEDSHLRLSSSNYILFLKSWILTKGPF